MRRVLNAFRPSSWFGAKAPTKPRKFRLYTSAKEREAAKQTDINTCVSFTEMSRSLANLRLVENHPLFHISASLRDSIAPLDATTQSLALSTSIAQTLEALCKEYSPSIGNHNFLVASSDDDSKLQVETYYRLLYFQKYWAQLDRVSREGDVLRLSSTAAYQRIIDAVLLGSGSERLSEHLRLYSPMFTQLQLQEALYATYEPEVAACSELFCVLQKDDPKYVKKVKRYASTYLLDKLELNTKSRCVFCWSDTGFSGFKALPDEHEISVDELLRARREFFKEGEEIAATLMKDITAEQRLMYYDREEFREQRNWGIVYFLVTCILDTVVMAL